MTIDPIWLYIGLILLSFLSITLFFLHSRLANEAAEQKVQLAQLSQKAEQLATEKSQVEQWAVQYKVRSENAENRISEKESEIHRLQAKIDQAAQLEDQQESYINELKERIGASQAKAESFEEQLAFSHQRLNQKEQECQRLNGQFTQSQNELTELRTTLNEKQANFEEQQRNFVQVKQQLNMEFQHLAQQILEEKSQLFAQSNQSSLDALLKPFKEQIEGFQKRVNEVHSESLKGTANLEAEIKRVLQIGVSMSEEAQNLATALKGNNKIAGNWGEVQLESALQSAGLLANEHYVAQENFRDEEGKRFAPDFVLHLPDNKHLIIDSKVSLVAYDKAIRAENQAEVLQAFDEHCRSLRAHIDGLSKKN